MRHKGVKAKLAGAEKALAGYRKNAERMVTRCSVFLYNRRRIKSGKKEGTQKHYPRRAKLDSFQNEKQGQKTPHTLHFQGIVDILPKPTPVSPCSCRGMLRV